MNKDTLRGFAPKEVRLRGGVFLERFNGNREYVLGLQNQNLLQNHYLEAGLGSFGQLRNTTHGEGGTGDNRHWGWESPTCQLRGHFLGHWLSAAARISATTGDVPLKHKADEIVAELARCQEKNGGEWVFSIPEKYLHWTANGQPTWAPQYVLHKTLMGLVDMHLLTGNKQALDILCRASEWFHRWTAGFDRAKLDDLLDVETGGMLEVWANAYALTGSREHKDLIVRYDRPRLFDELLKGRDALTNKHANTTIPEAHGAARAYEVTGDERWRRIVEAYWKCAVEDRGCFCTGSQTAGEIWTPPFEFAARRGDKNQEHCVVYNMIRLADYLFRWTGDVKYSDYIERNLYNGILAQQNPRTGMVSYFLALEAGARKIWGSPTYDFWCCHGSLVQAHALYNALIYYADKEGVVVSQYIPSRLETSVAGKAVEVAMAYDHCNQGAADNNASAAGSRHPPESWFLNITVSCPEPLQMTLKLRVPWWVKGKPTLRINGRSANVKISAGYAVIRRVWKKADAVRWELPIGLSVSAIPDEPGTVAFLNGPVVLAGLCDKETELRGDPKKPERLLVPDNEREWGTWISRYRTSGQPVAIRFKPLYEVVDEPYTLYFPVRRAP